MEYVYVCKVKILGFGFVVETEEQAKAWVARDPEANYYDRMRFERAK